MMRLDHNRALTQVAQKIGKPVPRHQEDDRLGQPLGHAVSRSLPRRGRRPESLAELINDQAGSRTPSSRRCRSAARRSSRRAACRRRRARPTRRSTTCATGCSARRDGDWVTMGVPSDGSYGIPEGVIYGYPCTCKGGKYRDRARASRSAISAAQRMRRDAEGAARRARRREAPDGG